ncbi:WD40 repeat-like protein [Artomyces pyxidatus]|uniref:WD40 repeat-like protein n=1 Tax=Artomyces pyxidatus TaxID=48021 RepID=A0ACB8T187_9AGAM|nr:WD40 repeat-like protein [Artomyces pyxidatus]
MPMSLHPDLTTTNERNVKGKFTPTGGHESLRTALMSIQEREGLPAELAYTLLASLPRSSLVILQRRIVPLLQLDVVGLLPTEVSLLIFSYLSWKTLLCCSLVSRRWRRLADDYSLWKRLCSAKGWIWKEPSIAYRGVKYPIIEPPKHDTDDEGMGDEEDEVMMEPPSIPLDDSAFASMDVSDDDLSFFTPSPTSTAGPSNTPHSPPARSAPSMRPMAWTRHSAPAVIPSQASHLKPNYKLLHFSRTRLQHRFQSGSYRRLTLPMMGQPDLHANTIYCLQLYTYPGTGTQVLFTGSKDRTVKEWDLRSGTLLRTLKGVHVGSVLSICVFGGYLTSAGSDSKVVMWDLADNKGVKVFCDHADSVLCVRFDEKRLVSCSKDRTVRTYLMSDLKPQHVLRGHRAAVNAVSISSTYIVSASGDRSMRLWDAETGDLLRSFENQHSRGIASLDLDFPMVLSGSSDKHIRLFNMETQQGWSTSPEFDTQASIPLPAVATPIFDEDDGDGDAPLAVCNNCGGAMAVADTSTARPQSTECARKSRHQCAHGDLVRNVALGPDFVVSGSYDLTVKVWDRRTGRLIADLVGGHTGRIFCVGFDCTKIVSCGEDQKICLWDFGYGMDTSFIKP